MDPFSYRKIRNTAILTVMMIVFGLSLFYAYYGGKEVEESHRNFRRIQTDHLSLLVKYEIDQLSKRQASRLQSFIQTNPEIIKALTDRDRQRLHFLTKKKLKLLKEESAYPLSLIFLLPGNEVFLRTHKPDVFGDNVGNLLPIKEMNRTMHAVSGMSVGKIGPALRSFTPITLNGEHIGAIGLVIQLGAFPETIGEVLGANILFLINKSFAEVIKLRDKLAVGDYIVFGAESDIAIAKKISSFVDFDLIDQEINIGNTYYHIHTNKLTDFTGELLGNIMIINDITHETNEYRSFIRKVIFSVLLVLIVCFIVLYISFNYLLNSMVKLNEELEDAHKELVRKEKLSALGQLTATIAHEIRNPLGTVRTSVFSIGDAIERDQPERIGRALKLAERNITRCDTIIEELLSFTRRKELNLKLIAVDSLLEQVINELVFPEGIEWGSTLESGAEAEIDPDHLRRAVINIIDNAIHALQEEDSSLNQLQIKTRINDDRVEIRVSDTGPGIEDDILERVFEPLFSTKGFGAGLGMPIVKDIMTEHHGGVEIETRPGKGTTVVLWLPVYQGQG